MIMNFDLLNILSSLNFFISVTNLSIGHVFPIQFAQGATKITFLYFPLFNFRVSKFLLFCFVKFNLKFGGRFLLVTSEETLLVLCNSSLIKFLYINLFFVNRKKLIALPP